MGIIKEWRLLRDYGAGRRAMVRFLIRRFKDAFAW